MKKHCKKQILILLSFCVLLFSSCSIFASEKLISTSISPTKTYTLEAYSVNGGATTAYTIKVYSVNEKNQKLIYRKYNEDNVEIKWIDNNTVKINEVILNMENDETFNVD